MLSTIDPIHKREFHAFLSHAHVDKPIVDKLYAWLSQIAGVPVWYDASLPASSSILRALPEAISKCRGMIIAVSRGALQSGWVQEEYDMAVGQRTAFREYRILPVRLDDSPVPHFLQTTKWIDLPDGVSGMGVADELLAGLYGNDVGCEPGNSSDVYISRTWHESDSRLADYVCELLDLRGLRLIGDSRDQAGFDEGQRVNSIMSSCGALVAVLPDRGGGTTSQYMLKEIAFGQQFNLPCLVVAEPSVRVPPGLESITVRVPAEEAIRNGPSEQALIRGINRIEEEWEKPRQAHYVFFATVFGSEHAERNRVLRQVIERVTGMPCIMGDDIREGQIQQVIIDRLSKGFLVIADISEENLNTCIEAGVALGAKRRLHFVAAGPRHRPPFMFRDQQVWYYGDDAELVGRIHKIAFPYRRRVVNLELRK